MEFARRRIPDPCRARLDPFRPVTRNKWRGKMGNISLSGGGNVWKLPYKDSSISCTRARILFSLVGRIARSFPFAVLWAKPLKVSSCRRWRCFSQGTGAYSSCSNAVYLAAHPCFAGRWLLISENSWLDCRLIIKGIAAMFIVKIRSVQSWIVGKNSL